MTIAAIASDDASRLLLALLGFGCAGWLLWVIRRQHNVFAFHLGFAAFWLGVASAGMLGLVAEDYRLPALFVEALNFSYGMAIIALSTLAGRALRRLVT